MIEPIRLLAFAFAGADLLFEIDRDGTILFATGATSGFSGTSDLVGKPATELFSKSERYRLILIARGLMPGERAEIVVCGGGGRLRIQRAEALEISPLGYHYLSKLPPTALDRDSVTQGAHTPDRRATPCSALDPESIAGLLRAGRTRWVDVADFFSRHNCERFRYSEEYRHGGDARALPFVPPDPPSHTP